MTAIHSKNKYRRTKLACYSANIAMALAGNVPPLLFLTFRSMYGISYSLLGLLVVVNFITQLVVDLIFSFFSDKFNIPAAVKTSPVLSVLGLGIFALWPTLFPDSAYLGLVIGTIIFSAACGFNEVLISPVIAAIPAKDPDREMSKLHSIYAWGVVAMIIISTVFLTVFGGERWNILILLLLSVPIASFILFLGAEIPEKLSSEKVEGAGRFLKRPVLWLCFFAIFLGGASECTMAQWMSGFLETSLSIPKIWGDILGAALFAVALGLGRTLYSKIGKKIGRALFFGAVGAAVCYLIAALSDIPLLVLPASAFTGFCVSMMWPGSLVVASNRIADGGVFIFAMMAAGGDLGASVGPQLIGVITDLISSSEAAATAAVTMGLTPEKLGMKAGMLTAAIFPLAAIPIYFYIMRSGKRYNEQNGAKH